MAMNNYLAAIPSFFLKNSRMNAYVSNPFIDGQVDTFDSDTVYRMYVILGNNNSRDVMYVDRATNPYHPWTTANKKWGTWISPGGAGPAAKTSLSDASTTPVYSTGQVQTKRHFHSKDIWASPVTMYERTKPFLRTGFDAEIAPLTSSGGTPIFSSGGENTDIGATAAASPNTEDGVLSDPGYWTSTKYEYFGSSFGPPIAISSSFSGSSRANPSSASYAPYTPPYYNGQSVAVIDFFPPHQVSEGSKYYNFEEVKQNSRVTYIRECDAPFMTHDWGHNVHELCGISKGYGGTINIHYPDELKSLAARGAMQIDASINLWGSRQGYRKAKFNAQDQIIGLEDPNTEDLPAALSWIIEPKFECPVVHYDQYYDSEIALPISGSGSISTGLWHQYSKDFGSPDEENRIPLTTDKELGVYFSLHHGPSSFGESAGTTVTLSDHFTDELISTKYKNPTTGLSVTKLADLKHKVGFTLDTNIPSIQQAKVTSGIDDINDIIKAAIASGSPMDLEAIYNEYYESGLFEDVMSLGKDTQTKIGQIGTSKKISEAVVAIPFTSDPDTGMMKLYTFPRGWVNYTKSQDINDLISIPLETMDLIHAAAAFDPEININSSEIIPDMLSAAAAYKVLPSVTVQDQIKRMQKYVFPPHLDFINNPTLNPHIMYIFEFEHMLNREDLSNIWQNLPPKSLMDIWEPKQTVSSVDHHLFISEFFGLSKTVESADPNQAKGLNQTLKLPYKDIRWMVFKVKQRAPKEYYNTTLDQSDDILQLGTKTQAGQGPIADQIVNSYNWPYDYFTMIELIKMEAGFDYRDLTEIDPGAPIQNTGLGTGAGTLPAGDGGVGAGPSPAGPLWKGLNWGQAEVYEELQVLNNINWKQTAEEDDNVSSMPGMTSTAWNHWLNPHVDPSAPPVETVPVDNGGSGRGRGPAKKAKKKRGRENQSSTIHLEQVRQAKNEAVLDLIREDNNIGKGGASPSSTSWAQAVAAAATGAEYMSPSAILNAIANYKRHQDNPEQRPANNSEQGAYAAKAGQNNQQHGADYASGVDANLSADVAIANYVSDDEDTHGM